MDTPHPHRATISPLPEGIPRPLWSVMIPTYNCAKFLRTTLASVLAQDPGADVMQIEVIDDCSTQDDPAAVVAELGRGRVGFYRQPQNVGHTKNFETCLQRSRGKLIHLLHGDDCVRDGFYFQMQQAFEQHSEIGAAFCRHIFMDEHGHWHYISHLEQSANGVLHNWLEQLALMQRIQTPSMVVRHEVYERLGGFDHRLSWTEDWEMWVRIAANYPIYYLVDPLAVYRVHSVSNTGRYVRTGENVRDVRRAINIIESYLAPTTAKKIANQAREGWALHIINSNVKQLLVQRDLSAATAQVREAIQCSYSFAVMSSLLRLFFWAATQWTAKKLRTLLRLRDYLALLREFCVQPLMLRSRIKHLHGLKKINYAENELIVTCVVRNGELYIKSFIEHYLALGVKHIVFLDNGSTDDTISIACQYENITVLQTHCPYQTYETVMKRYLVKRFSKNRWNLFADIDELFDYPFSDVLNLKALLNYLNKNSYTAVVAQMLDLFCETSLTNIKSYSDDSLKATYNYYDISNITSCKYPYGTLSNSKINHYFGGIRKTLFGTNNGLSKAALIRADDKIQPFFNFHHVKKAYIADFTAVLLHYPFVSSFPQKVLEAVQTERYKLSANHEYKMYWQTLQDKPDLNFKQQTANKLENINALIVNDFLVVSSEYIEYVKGYTTKALVNQI